VSLFKALEWDSRRISRRIGKNFGKFLQFLNLLLSFLVHYEYYVHLLDIEWLLSTLFDASLLSP
jgi:hypothetical protein